MCCFADASNEFAKFAYIADYRRILDDYAANRTQLFKLGAERYNEKALKLNIKRAKDFIVASDGLTNASVFPVFLASLETVHAPKSCQNVANNLIDFMNFLLERFGSDGPGMRKLVRPESIKAQLNAYKQTLDKPARQWRNTQVLLDFQEMPSQAQIKEVRSKAVNLTEILIEKGLTRGYLNDEDYMLLMKCMVCIVVMRNACRVSSAIYIKNEHYRFRCKGPEWINYKLPLCPANQIARKP